MEETLPDDFEAMWADLAPVGRSATTGGYFRQPFLSAERELVAWFVEQCAARGLRVETDGFGNTIGWWDPAPTAVEEVAQQPAPTAVEEVAQQPALTAVEQVAQQPALTAVEEVAQQPALTAVEEVAQQPALTAVEEVAQQPALTAVEEVAQQPSRNPRSPRADAVLTGSHLDSVLDGGAYDGPLGVVSALAALDELRARGVVPTRPLGIAVFAEEEGSRFGLACLGSRLATGALSWDDARSLRDGSGVALGDVLPGGTSDLLSSVGTFVELHVEQGRDLVDRDAPVGLASGIWPHGRYRFDFTGAANHAGTTRMADRADPMLTYAMTVLAANKQARLADQRATFGRVSVEPNGTNAVPSRVTGWLDARCSSEDALTALVEAVERQASDRASRDGTAVAVTAESVSGAVSFDAALAATLAGPRGWPVIPTQAGHDAGILQAAGIPTAMLFVRNPTGVSHSPAESAELADCLAGVTALADVLEGLL